MSDINVLLSVNDLEGRNCEWYFNKYQMFSILETKIMT